MSWTRLAVSPDRTHHVGEDGSPAYGERFDEVLKFHAPGLAPALRDARAWHIDADGSPAYPRRFARTFGFYEERAAVVGADGWHHIDPGGADVYARRYGWCGNFQGGRCAVREMDGSYLHIDRAGHAVYPARWRYAGDYRDGVAVVQAADGRSTHVDCDGRLLHGRWFHDLDVFHKGFARARDERGWMHVDLTGTPAYARRFAMVEPFYNGQARVERFDGGLEVVDERGAGILVLRAGAPAPAWHPGQIGDWTIGEELHRGSQGAVYASGPAAVVKSSSNLGAWAREVELLEMLDGQGAPRILDAFTRAGTGYLVLERIDGAPLGRRSRTRPRSARAAVRAGLALLRPIAILHDAGWIHSDVHPENAIEAPDRAQIALLDYASAVRMDEHGEWSGEVHWGRWELVPPEQFEGFTILDRSADTYAVCALLAYLAQGTSPFAVDVASLRRRGWDAVRAAFRATRANPDLARVPEPLRGVLARGLGRERTVRFAHARALARALEALDA